MKPAWLVAGLIILSGLGGCAATVPALRYPKLEAVQVRLDLPDKDWD